MTNAPWSAQEITQRVDAVFNDAMYWFPVRHHSIAVAQHLQTALAERKPKIIFIEAPAEAQGLIEHIIDKKSSPPIAIYSSYRDDNNVLGLAGIESPAPDIPPRFSSWYPLLAYSPEYVAMQAASALGAKVVFMDLPHHGLIEAHRPPLDQAIDNNDESDAADVRDGRRSPYPEEQLYQQIAKNAGYRHWDEAWDSLFEFGDYSSDLERFRRELATFCAAARLTADPQRLEFDGTLARERFMRQTINDSLAKTGIDRSEAMIVCGGFHLFMDWSDNAAPPPLPQGTTFNAVIPYSYFQLSELSGYAAGNRAPRFYQRIWETGKSETDEWLAQHIVAIIKQARKEGESVSSADAISIAQHARMLASLRGRATPVLEDIEDAVITCCCKGEPALEGQYLQRAIHNANIGSRIGKVSDAAPMLPLVRDFYQQLDALQLQTVSEKERLLNVKLDLREQAQRNQSVFFHRLCYLDAPLAVLVEGDGSNLNSATIFREVWRLRWDPKLEPKLIENNLFGDTIESAVFAKLELALAKLSGDAGQSCEILHQAVNMELATCVTKMEAVCEHAIASDGRFISLSKALHELQLVRRHAIYQQFNYAAVDQMLQNAFDRACFSLPESANVPEEEQASVIDALRVVSEALLANDAYDRELFLQHVRYAAELTEVAYLRGAFLGLLAELRVISAQDLSDEVAAYAKDSAEVKVQAGDFLDGILSTCRTSLLIGADHLVNAINELFVSCDEESYLIMLPRLRIAFNRLHQRQLDSLADHVAQHLGLKSAEQLTVLETSVESAALLARIDKQVAAIMAKWNF